MTESPRRERPDPSQPILDYPDPAYAGQSYQPSYPATPAPGTNPTQQLPPGYQYGYGADGHPSEAPAAESDDGGSRLWLWILAGLAVLAVLALVIALVINNSSRQETVVAPQPVGPEPGAATTTSPRTTAPRTTAPTAPRTTRPVPPPPTAPTTPGATETVTYEVSGEGRAINITYVDSGNMLQTEFNVILPWSKQVELPEPATETASVSVINFGPDVTCTVTVNGVQTQNRTGTGLTVCVGAGGPPR